MHRHVRRHRPAEVGLRPTLDATVVDSLTRVAEKLDKSRAAHDNLLAEHASLKWRCKEFGEQLDESCCEDKKKVEESKALGEELQMAKEDVLAMREANRSQEERIHAMETAAGELRASYNSVPLLHQRATGGDPLPRGGGAGDEVRAAVVVFALGGGHPKQESDESSERELIMQQMGASSDELLTKHSTLVERCRSLDDDCRMNEREVRSMKEEACKFKKEVDDSGRKVNGEHASLEWGYKQKLAASEAALGEARQKL